MSSKIIKITMLSVIFIIFLVTIIFLLFVIKPKIEKISDNFHYEAEIFSLDNFYSIEKGDFLGEINSETKFSYDVVSQRGEILIIKNLFDVRKPEGGKIFAVERLYGINAKTGEHVKGYGDRDRDGYLFAPRSLKKGENYEYWHINYDSPANMKFQEEEELYGLKVYRYMADYKADQTKELLNLHLVGKERGVELEVNLQTWIEPVTGRLIKYEDKTLAYYYDLKTGEKISPWNKFNNRYREESVKEQVDIAKKEKLLMLFIGKIIPSSLILVYVILLIFLLRNNPKKYFRKIKTNKK